MVQCSVEDGRSFYLAFEKALDGVVSLDTLDIPSIIYSLYFHVLPFCIFVVSKSVKPARSTDVSRLRLSTDTRMPPGFDTMKI